MYIVKQFGKSFVMLGQNQNPSIAELGNYK